MHVCKLCYTMVAGDGILMLLLLSDSTLKHKADHM